VLKNLDPLLVPPLLAALAEMGHGDVIAVVDRNFAAYSHTTRVIDLPTASTAQVMRAICSVLPLDLSSDSAVIHLLTDQGHESPVTTEVRRIWTRAEVHPVSDKGLRRPEFYPQVRDAYCAVRTGEVLPHACYLLRKGIR